MPPAHLAYTTNLTHHHPVGAGHTRPATYPILQLVAIAQQIPNMHLAQKSLSKFVKKIPKVNTQTDNLAKRTRTVAENG